MMLDIGYGPADTTVTEVCYHFPVGHLGSGRWLWPAVVPAGNKIFGRIQALQVSDTLNLTIRSFQQGFAVPSVKTPAVVYGVTTATSVATPFVQTAGSTNTKTAFETIATTTQPHQFITVSANAPSITSVSTNFEALIDFAVVKDGADSIIYPDVWWNLTASETASFRGTVMPIVGPFPTGTVLRARYQVSVVGISRPAVAFCGW